MELRQLRYFVAVAEELSFSRAAARVHISQPPLSRQVRLLEEGLGVQLLERDKHHVRLTEAGTVFLQHAQALLADAQSAALSAQRAARGEVGRLVIGFIGSAIYSCLPRVLRSFRESYPDVELVPTPLTISQQLDALRTKQIDAGFVRQPVQAEGIETVRLLREPYMVALPSGHRLAQEQTISLRALNSERFIIFRREEGPGAYNAIMQLCRRSGFTPSIAQEAGPMTTVIGLVGSGIGVAIVPASTQSIRIDEVVYRPLGGRRPAFTEFALALRKTGRSMALTRFVEIARQATQVPASDASTSTSDARPSERKDFRIKTAY
jgi:DNA-binding transcriptional LysR family regulator